VTVRHPAFRAFDRWRIEMNDAGIALLVCARIGRAELETASKTSRQTYLPDLFPAIPEIKRLHRKPGDAARLAADAEATYALMAIPFIVAVVNDYLVTIGEMLNQSGKWKGKRVPTELFLGPLRKSLRKSGLHAPVPYNRLMDFVQTTRNTITHGAGIATPALERAWKDQSVHAKKTWTNLAGRQPPLIAGSRMAFGSPEVNAAWAITHRLAVGLNDELVATLPRSMWAQIAVVDYRTLHPDSYKHRDRRLASVAGFARTHYGPLQLSADELRPYLA
jgi:hypothetical protein